jgi:hypothetical protein
MHKITERPTTFYKRETDLFDLLALITMKRSSIYNRLRGDIIEWR